MYRDFEDVFGKTHRFVTTKKIRDDLKITIDLCHNLSRDMMDIISGLTVDLSVIDKQDAHDMIDLLFDPEFDVLNPDSYHTRINKIPYETVASVLIKELEIIHEYPHLISGYKWKLMELDQLDKHKVYCLSILGVYNSDDWRGGTVGRFKDFLKKHNLDN